MFSLSFSHFRRLISHRAFVALADQGAVSIAGFGTGMLLSRAFGLERRAELGLYYLAVTISILIVELQNALVSTPHTVMAPTLDPQRLRRFNGSSLIHNVVLSLMSTLVLALLGFASPALGMKSHRPMLLASAVTTIAIGLRNFARYLNFALHRPHIACLGDSLVTALQLGGILLLWRANFLSAWSVVSVIGIASLAGGGLMILLTSGELEMQLGFARSDFRDNWRLSRWVFASGVIGNTGASLYPWVIDRLSSTLQAALWGNCSTISSTGNPLLLGLQNWIGPSVAHAYADDRGPAFRRHVLRLSLVFLLILPPTLVVLALITNPLLHHLYHDYTPNTVRLVLLLACGSVIASASFVISRGLYSRRRGELDVWGTAAPLVVLLTLGWPMVRAYGAVGGAISLLVAQVLGMIVRTAMFWAVTTPHAVAATEPTTASPLIVEPAA